MPSCPWGSRVGEGKNFKPKELGVGWLEETEGTPGGGFNGTLNWELTVLRTQAGLTWAAGPFLTGCRVYLAHLGRQMEEEKQATDTVRTPALSRL